MILFQLGSAIHDCLNFVQEISELQTFGAGQIFEVDLSVGELLEIVEILVGFVDDADMNLITGVVDGNDNNRLIGFGL